MLFAGGLTRIANHPIIAVPAGHAGIAGWPDAYGLISLARRSMAARGKRQCALAINAGHRRRHGLPIREGRFLPIREGHLLSIREGHLPPIREGRLPPIREGRLLPIRPDLVQRLDRAHLQDPGQVRAGFASTLPGSGPPTGQTQPADHRSYRAPHPRPHALRRPSAESVTHRARRSLSRIADRSRHAAHRLRLTNGWLRRGRTNHPASRARLA